MMKKIFLAAGVSLLLVSPIFAEGPATLADRIDRVDEVIYGSAQEGSLVGRVDSADNLIYGNGNTSASGLDNRITNLYTDVVKNEDDTHPSISVRVNAMEYYLTDEIKREALKTRVADLEKKVYGAEKKGAMDQRLMELEKSVYGDQHYEMKDVELPANTVFKISLNDDVSSKINQVGDPVTFTVDEDVMVGDVLVLPKGSQGSGVVTKVSRPKSFGRSGTLDVSFDQVFSVDDESIPTVLGPEAKEKLKMEAAAVGASTIGALALGPIGLVGGFFVRGKDVTLPAGSTLYIETQQTVHTKGLVLANGAPGGTVRKHIVRAEPQAAASADNKISSQESSLSQAEAKPVEKVEKESSPSQAGGDQVNEKAKAELESVREKDTADNDSGKNDDSPSVVIVRNN